MSSLAFFARVAQPKLTTDRSLTFTLAPRPLGDITGNLEAGVGALVDFLELLEINFSPSLSESEPRIRHRFWSQSLGRFGVKVVDCEPALASLRTRFDHGQEDQG